MNNRHISVDSGVIKGDYFIRFWDNGEVMHILHTQSVGYYTLTITDWLDGENFKNF